MPGQDAHSQGFCAELHPPALCQLLQLVPRPGQVPHKVPVKARLLQVHRWRSDSLDAGRIRGMAARESEKPGEQARPSSHTHMHRTLQDQLHTELH